ncbi:MAG: hypothetical protein NTV34_05410 [Proteobacteria bacterium]|nr:hypothetical protein [Pseudomonadota bacterium]
MKGSLIFIDSGSPANAQEPKPPINTKTLGEALVWELINIEINIETNIAIDANALNPSFLIFRVFSKTDLPLQSFHSFKAFTDYSQLKEHH